MSKNELDDLFNQINNYLGNDDQDDQEELEGGQFDPTFSHDNEAKEDGDDVEDKTEIYEQNLQPLIKKICIACQKHGIPAQFAVKCSKTIYATMAVCWEKSVQVQAAHALYKLPHSVSHLVMFSMRKPAFPMVVEESFPGVDEDNDMRPMLRELVEKAMDLDLPLQWGMVLSRKTKDQSDLDPQTIIADSVEEAFSQMADMMMKMFSERDLSHQNVWGGIHMSDRHHSCHMSASSAFYHTGSSLAGEIMALYSDLNEEDDIV